MSGRQAARSYAMAGRQGNHRHIREARFAVSETYVTAQFQELMSNCDPETEPQHEWLTYQLQWDETQLYVVSNVEFKRMPPASWSIFQQHGYIQ